MVDKIKDSPYVKTRKQNDDKILSKSINENVPTNPILGSTLNLNSAETTSKNNEDDQIYNPTSVITQFGNYGNQEGLNTDEYHVPKTNENNMELENLNLLNNGNDPIEQNLRTQLETNLPQRPLISIEELDRIAGSLECQRLLYESKGYYLPLNAMHNEKYYTYLRNNLNACPKMGELTFKMPLRNITVFEMMKTLIQNNSDNPIVATLNLKSPPRKEWIEFLFSTLQPDHNIYQPTPEETRMVELPALLDSRDDLFKFRTTKKKRILAAKNNRGYYSKQDRKERQHEIKQSQYIKNFEKITRRKVALQDKLFELDKEMYTNFEKLTGDEQHPVNLGGIKTEVFGMNFDNCANFFPKVFEYQDNIYHTYHPPANNLY